MLVALSTIAAEQAKVTSNTAKAVIKLLNYAATHPNATIRYHASDMILYAHSDASYLSSPKARSLLVATSSSANSQTMATKHQSANPVSMAPYTQRATFSAM
jgi:hypothetical protein